jgi:Transposase
VAIGWRAELMEPGYECEVIAPAKFARRPRDRIKTDRRDALLLARQTRAGELVKVAIPDARDEALRDLSRTREDASDVEGQHRADDPTAEQEGAEQLEIYCECNELSVLKTACRPSVASVFPGVA